MQSPIEELFKQACEEGNITEVKWILDRYPSFFQTTDGVTNACRRGHVEIVRMIMKKEPDHGYGDGFLAACSSGRLEVVKLLRPKIHERDMEKGLLQSALLGKVDVVMYLVEQGAPNHWSAVHAAARKPQNTKVIRFLLSIAERTQETLDSLFSAACRLGCVHNAQAVLDYGPRNVDQLFNFLNDRNCAYLAVFKFYSKIPIRPGDYWVKRALRELCFIFLGLETKGIPKHITRDKIFAYL
jgi:hypothetical protein